MKCHQCGNIQDEGKFCGKCGSQLIVAETETAATTANDSVEKVRDASIAFWTYFVHYLKQPAEVFSNRSNDVRNGIINIIITAILFSLAFYHIIKFDFYGMGPSFLSVFISTLFILVVLMAIILCLLLIMNKFFGDTTLSFTDITSIYGVHMIPVAIIAAVTLLFALADALGFASFLLSVAFLLITMIIPLYLISSLLTRHSKVIDPFYGYIIYIVTVFIAFMIIFAIFIDSMLNQFMSDFL